MAYRYPKISSSLTYKKRGDTLIVVEDCLWDETIIVDKEEAEFIRKLDGKTHPYHIDTKLTHAEIDSLIRLLKQRDMLRKSRTIYSEGGTTMQTLWEPKWTISLKVLAFFWNYVLLIGWLPVFLIGLFVFANHVSDIDTSFVGWGLLLGMIVGALFHEVGHAFAGACYGAKVFEAGVTMMYYVIPGAYVLLDDYHVDSVLKRVQIKAAGVESNLLLAGVFFLLSTAFPQVGGLFFWAATNNIIIAVLNLSLLKGLDGASVIGVLLGTDDIVEEATEVVLCPATKREMKQKGATGKAAVALCYIVTIAQVAFPTFLILNVLEVIACFV